MVFEHWIFLRMMGGIGIFLRQLDEVFLFIKVVRRETEPLIVEASENLRCAVGFTQEVKNADMIQHASD